MKVLGIVMIVISVVFGIIVVYSFRRAIMDWDLYVESQCCYDDGPDERQVYELIKKWKNYTDEQMKEIDLDEEWENYLADLREKEADYILDHRY